MPRQPFSKFLRPKEPAPPGVITDRGLDILAAVLRYRFSPASELVRLVAGNERRCGQCQRVASPSEGC
jgi:hypothetical protein